MQFNTQIGRSKIPWNHECFSASIIVTDSSGGRPERRRMRRVEVRLPVRLSDAHDRTVNTSTVNVSCDGFYCLSREAFPLAATINAVIEVAIPKGGTESPCIALDCKAVLVRLDRAADGLNYGMAFRILDYSVVRSVPESAVRVTSAAQ